MIWPCLLLLLAPSLPNFRLVSDRTPYLYRSSSLDNVSIEDATQLVDASPTICLELRNEDEFGRLTEGGLLLASSKNTTIVHLPLMEDVDSLFNHVAFKELPMPKRAEALFYFLTDAKKYDSIIISSLTLLTLYKAILATARPKVCEAVRLCLTAKEGRMIIVNCAKGKDRTGLVSALVSLKVGVPRKEVVEAYASSEDLLKEGDYVGGQERKGGMDWGRLRGSPPEVMEEVISWVDSTYGR